MKTFILLLTALAGALTAPAADYAFLTFETTDGAKVSVPVSTLTISISGTTLTAGSQSFRISNLSKMYFSNTDTTTGIVEMTSATLNEATEIYDLQGHKVPKKQVRKGVYIVKMKDKTYKMLAR